MINGDPGVKRGEADRKRQDLNSGWCGPELFSSCTLPPPWYLPDHCRVTALLKLLWPTYWTRLAATMTDSITSPALPQLAVWPRVGHSPSDSLLLCEMVYWVWLYQLAVIYLGGHRWLEFHHGRADTLTPYSSVLGEGPQRPRPSPSPLLTSPPQNPLKTITSLSCRSIK